MLAADVQIRVDTSRPLVELVAHEFEHILEQLDGIDLTRWIGRSGCTASAEAATIADRNGTGQAHGRIVAGEYAAAPSTTPSCGTRS